MALSLAANAEGISYHGVKRINFAITGTSLSGIVVNNLPKAGYPYTGDEIQPLELKDENGNALITVTMKKNGPEVDSDVYEVRYEKNKDKGTASMIFTGKADQGYTGTKKVTFKIAAASLTEGYRLNVAEEAVYTAGGTTPEVTVTDASGEELKAGVDYTVSYKNNKAVTTETTKKKPVAVVKGKETMPEHWKKNL